MKISESLKKNKAVFSCVILCIYGLVLLVMAGIIKLILAKFKMQRYSQIVTGISNMLSILAVVILAMAREAYEVVVLFLLLVMKGIVILKYMKV